MPSSMSKTLLATTATAVLALTTLLVPSEGSAADAGFGSVFDPTSSCVGLTLLQTSSVAGSHTIPAAGVITSWRSIVGTTAPSQVAFKVGRPSGGGYEIVGTSDPVAPAADGLTGGKVRVPVKTGDVLGIYSTGNCIRAVAGYGYSYATGNAPVGPFAVASSGTGVQLDIAATWESDADGDGFGDVSQDLCPTDKNTQAVCGTGAPETTITTITAARAKKAKGKVTAVLAASEAASFECALDSPVFSPCASPYVVKAKVGKHVLAVRATDTAGNVDRSAAVRSFKVKPARR